MKVCLLLSLGTTTEFIRFAERRCNHSKWKKWAERYLLSPVRHDPLLRFAHRNPYLEPANRRSMPGEIRSLKRAIHSAATIPVNTSMV